MYGKVYFDSNSIKICLNYYQILKYEWHVLILSPPKFLKVSYLQDSLPKCSWELQFTEDIRNLETVRNCKKRLENDMIFEDLGSYPVDTRRRFNVD